MIWQAGGEDSAEFYAENCDERPPLVRRLVTQGWNFSEGD